MKNITLKRNDISSETRLLRSIEGSAVKSFTVSPEGISIVCGDHIILHIDQKLKITGNFVENPDAVKLNDVAEIVMVSVSEEERTVDVVYKDFAGLVNSYRFYEDDITIWSQCQNIRSYKTEVLNDSRHTQLDFSYNDEYFCPMYHVDEDGKRVRYGYYDLDYPCTTFGRKVRFEIDDDTIRVHGIGHFEHFLLMTKEAYACLSDFDRMSLHRFVKTAEAYINNLYVNRDYENEIVLNGDECDEVQEIIDKLSAVLEEGGFKKKCYFSDGEQGHPAGSEVYIFDDGEVKFVWYWQIEFYGSGDYVIIKCDDKAWEKIVQFPEAQPILDHMGIM